MSALHFPVRTAESATGSGDHQLFTSLLFGAIVLVTIGVRSGRAAPTSGAADYYAGGGSFSGFQNGLAIGGDYMSAASFLGISGAIALAGYDGFLCRIGFLVAWLVALLLVAELLGNWGCYTMADQLGLPDAPASGPQCPQRLDGRRSRCSTCWRRWSAPARWSRCCSAWRTRGSIT